MNLHKIINESVRKVLLEMDLMPTDQQGNVNLVNRQSINAWRMIMSRHLWIQHGKAKTEELPIKMLMV